MLCEKLSKFSIPAVRIAVSRSLYDNYGMSQNGIATVLSIAQPAVYKYLNNKYSRPVFAITNYLMSKGLHKRIVAAVISGRDPDEIRGMVEKLASSRQVSSYCNYILKSKR
ncbi:hypothetical protein M1583_01640 [Candidatus Marsarchaeota archaeon]|nr:hypothetical protein [Candidatus Marsarchaeota archaeon]